MITYLILFFNHINALQLSGAKNHIEELSHKISCIEVKIHAVSQS